MPPVPTVGSRGEYPPKQLHVTIIRFLVLILPSFPSPFLSLSSTYSAEQGYAADAAEAAKAAGIASTFAANTAAGGAATRSRMKGVVKRWVINGYGFIQPEDDKSGNGNLFCHYSEIADGNMLAEGAAVEFEKQWSDQKRTFQCKNVSGGYLGASGSMPPGGNTNANANMGGSSEPVDRNGRARGKVLKWNQSRGFGFIQAEGSLLIILYSWNSTLTNATLLR